MVAAQKKARDENAAAPKRTHKRAHHALLDARAPQAPARRDIYPGHLEMMSPQAHGPMDASLMDACVAMAKAQRPNTSLDSLLLISAAECAPQPAHPTLTDDS